MGIKKKMLKSCLVLTRTSKLNKMKQTKNKTKKHHRSHRTDSNFIGNPKAICFRQIQSRGWDGKGWEGMGRDEEETEGVESNGKGMRRRYERMRKLGKL